MHKIKNAISRLQQYLGRDKQGLALLDEIATIANELRKNVAAEARAADAATKRAAVIRSKLDEAENTIEMQRVTLTHEKAVRHQRDTDVARLTVEIARLTAEIESMLPDKITAPESTERVVHNTVSDLRRVTEVMNSVIRKIRRCPAPSRRTRRKVDQLQVFALTDVASDLSNDSLLLLGQFVACMAVCGFPCVVESEITVADTQGAVGREKLLRRFVRWFSKKNIDFGKQWPDGRIGVPSYLHLQGDSK